MSLTNHIIPAAALWLERDGQIFVGRRVNTGYHDGLLNLPAGHIDPGETPIEAIVREVKEEVGIEVPGDELMFLHTQYNRNVSEGKADRTHYYFKYELPAEIEPFNAEPDKCSETFWVPVGERIDEFFPFMRGAVEAILAGERYSEFYDQS